MTADWRYCCIFIYENPSYKNVVVGLMIEEILPKKKTQNRSAGSCNKSPNDFSVKTSGPIICGLLFLYSIKKFYPSKEKFK
jgi:hypothetical protein